MSEIKQMYNLLEKMVESAKINNRDRTLELHKEYTTLSRDFYHDPLTPLDLKFDKCRNRCVESIGILRSIHEQMISEAEKTLSELRAYLDSNIQ